MIQPAPPPARNRIASTTSSGCAVAAERVEVADALEHLLGLLGGEEALVGGRLDERERDRVDADLLRRELEREVLGQRVAARLRGRVGAGRGGGDRVDRPHRADVDDRAAALLLHRRGRRLRDPVGRAQDRAERLLEVLLGLLEERDDAEDAGRVDEHVDAAEALDGGRDERLRLLARGDLAGVDVDALAGRVEGVAGGLELGLAGAAEDDARALLEEALRCGAADAAAAAGDQDDLVLELHGEPPVEDRCRCIEYTCVCI